ncbi:hypothetical protein [Geoglobus acetivorans]|uniref:Uncharacterized protein n=1 Tax=Geoglobus acetivorans TaxID=565033 RepID=A0A0A7GCG8_GEOAI|nr:hypothetical protein GACE_0489 [Geoglobus acetivorans]
MKGSEKMRNDEGKLSLDLLIGLTIFLMSFVFIIQYVPAIFASERSEIYLYPLAYRISALLVEDPGYWSNGSVNGTDWENYYSLPDVEVRPGLMGSEVNVLDPVKIDALNSLYASAGIDGLRKALGLKTPDRVFGFNISLQLLSSNSSNPIYSMNGSQPMLLIGEPIPDGSNVARYERIIAFENTTSVSKISSKLDTPNTVNYNYAVPAPVGSFVIVITGVNDNQSATEPWMRVDVNSINVIDVRGNETISTFDLTGDINQYSGTVNVDIQVHNVRGYVISTNAGEYIGGRIVAKLVVAVW